MPQALLFLDSQKLAQLPELIANPQAIIAYNNRLTTVPEWVWSMTALRRLNLSVNQLTTISEKIGQLEQLRIWFIFKQLS